MARLGSIYLGGKEGQQYSGKVFKSGVGFSLKSKSKIGKLFKYDNDKWEVEIIHGQDSIVARYQEILPIDKILAQGLEYCEKSLDMISVCSNVEMYIEDPGNYHTILFCSIDMFILRDVSTNNFPIGMSASITITDKDGNTIRQPEPNVSWITAFRFYRLSQASNDLFEAYRNLFLGFESLLNQICFKKKGEKEVEWIKRALTEVDKKVKLENCTPSNVKDPIQHIIDKQYKGIRCKLFHGKGNKIILPHESLNPSSVSDAYEELIKIWRHIASGYFNIPGGGGVVTFQGFKMMMDSAFQNEFSFQVTDDSTEPRDSDVAVSPLNRPVFSYKELNYIGDFRPGQILLTGGLEIEPLRKIQLIHRIGISLQDNLVSIRFINDGVYTVGIDRIESYQTIRLINSSMPKTIF